MINFLCSMLLFMSLNGCKSSPVPTSPTGEPPIIHTDPAEEPVPTPEPPKPDVREAPPSLEESFSTTGVKLKDANSTQAAKYAKALVIIRKVIQDPEFKKRVLAHVYAGKSGFASSTDTPAQVYKKLLSGAEKLQPVVDNEMDLEVRFYYAGTSTVGYTYPTVSYIMVNTKFFNNFTPRSVAANCLHEYMHKLGYGHDSAVTARRPYSVPYALGKIMTSLGAKYE